MRRRFMSDIDEPAEADHEDVNDASPAMAQDATETDAPPADTKVPDKSVSKAPARTAQFRRNLLGKLPKLKYQHWSARDSFKLDEEWGAAANLRADSVLEPLQAVAPHRLAAKESRHE